MATFHAVLAGAYRGKGKDLGDLLTHASLDNGDTALCGKVKEGHLCDLQEAELTCPYCIKKIARLNK